MPEKSRLKPSEERIQRTPTFEVRDKYSGEVLAELPSASEQDVRQAVANAAAAFQEWSRTPAHKRSRVLAAASAEIARRREEIAALICREAGKAWKYSLIEADRAAETFSFAAEEAKRIHGETLPMDASPAGEGRFGFYVRAPAGVVAAITPFNFPLNLVSHKVAPALAAGDAVVLKPSEDAPLSAVKLAEILAAAGLPHGVLNLVHGGADAGRWLIEDPRPAVVTFTGSPEVGEEITRRAGLKRVLLELGNNGGAIVEPDADWREALRRCLAAAFANSGQVCLSLQRLYVHESIFREFSLAFVEAAKALKTGDPSRKDCDVGPMIREEEASRAEKWVREAQREGAKVLLGGKRKGPVLEPTVLADVKPTMTVMCREVFAPVVSLIPYRDFDEALAALDDSPYGLQAGIFTKDLSKALKAVERLNVGGVMINDTPMFRVDFMPYGGNKRSGIGREGVRYAIEELTNLRTVVIKP